MLEIVFDYKVELATILTVNWNCHLLNWVNQKFPRDKPCVALVYEKGVSMYHFCSLNLSKTLLTIIDAPTFN